MMSAERFAQIAGSYWKTVLPGLSRYVRASNTAEFSFAPGISLRSDPNRHAAISEAAFLLWKYDEPDASISPGDVDGAFRLASNRLALHWDSGPFESGLAPHERADIDSLLKNLQEFARQSSITDVTLEPPLPGCGVVSSGTPDFIGSVANEDSSLRIIGEIKTVQRTFRSVDYRQMIAYLVLDFAANKRIADLLWLVNPARGRCITIDVDSFFWFVRSQSADESIAELAYEWSGPPLSP